MLEFRGKPNNLKRVCCFEQSKLERTQIPIHQYYFLYTYLNPIGHKGFTSLKDKFPNNCYVVCDEKYQHSEWFVCNWIQPNLDLCIDIKWTFYGVARTKNIIRKLCILDGIIHFMTNHDQRSNNCAIFIVLWRVTLNLFLKYFLPLQFHLNFILICSEFVYLFTN